MALDAKGRSLLGGIANAHLIGGAMTLSSTAKHREDSSAMSIAGIDFNNGQPIAGLEERAFQWWPETFADTIATGWNEKLLPAGSHALMQWGVNGGRTFTFELKLTRYMKTAVDLATEADRTAALINPSSTRNLPFNVDIKHAVRYLRAYCYPQFGQNFAFESPPAVCIFYAKGMGLNEDGGDVVFTVMTGCDVTYTRLFENGTPRNATVAIVLKQIVQSADGVFYKGRDLLIRDTTGFNTARTLGVTQFENRP